MTLDLTDAPVCDLRSISAYTRETWGDEQEEKYLAEMWDRFERIQKAPKDWRFREGLFPACQIAAQGKHVILFRIHGDVLQIVRVLHSAMDFKRHLMSPRATVRAKKSKFGFDMAENLVQSS